MIGRLRATDSNLADLFHSEGHAPALLTEEELAAGAIPMLKSDIWNLPEWMIDPFETSLGDQAEETAVLLQSRAPISLRVNLAKCSLTQAVNDLADFGIKTQLNPICDTALTIVDGARKLRNSPSYLEGWVELQDAASQAIVSDLPEGENVLDYCAGGGGKSLALAAQNRQVVSHDINFDRMTDLPARAERAGAKITLLATDLIATQAPFDLVLVDAPCSGSGAWRRSPEGKWKLNEVDLDALCDQQDQILDDTVQFVSSEGTLVYATCSLFKNENEDRVLAFLNRYPEWRCSYQKRLNVSAMADGFFVAHLTKSKN